MDRVKHTQRIIARLSGKLTACFMAACFMVSINLPLLQVQALPLYSAVTPRYSSSEIVARSEYFQLDLASSLISKNNCVQAIPFLLDANEIDPVSIFVHANLGHCYLELSKVSRDPYQISVLLDRAEEAYQRVQYLGPEYTSTYFKLGQIAIAQGNLGKSIMYYKMGLEVDSENVALIFNLARAYDQLMRYDEALNYYEQAISMDSDFIYAYNNVGLIYEQQGELEKAEEAYKAALSRDSDYSFARLNLGNLYAQMKQMDKAKKNYLMVIDAEPDNLWAHFYLGNTYFAEEDYASAAAEYNAAAKLNPEYANIYYFWSLALSKLSRYDDAISVGETYLTISPKGQYATQIEDLMRLLKTYQADTAGVTPATSLHKN